MKVKGIKAIFVFLILALVLMPFPVFADTTVPVTYNSQSVQSQWSSHLTVTNYCESPLQGSTPCKLTFTLDDNYYGMIAFDGYAGTSLALSYVTVFVAGGVGEYNYRTFSNANPMYINSVNIMGVGLHLPDTAVDLTDIIDLLTAIESDTTAIDATTDSTLIQLQSLVNQAIISNGYLETLTKLREYNFPIESFPFIYRIATLYPTSIYDVFVNGNYMYPIFKLNYTQEIFNVGGSPINYVYEMILFIDKSTSSISTLQNYIYVVGGDLSDIKYIARSNFSLLYCKVTRNTSTGALEVRSNVNNLGVIPIYMNLESYPYKSTDFSLQFGLRNELLENLKIIANGTTQSNSAASGLESSNSTMASDMNSMATIENGYSQDFNSQLQNIDFTNPIQQNQGILPAANFVISIFNGLISNNPFTVLIIIVCIMLIGKKVIGK